MRHIHAPQSGNQHRHTPFGVVEGQLSHMSGAATLSFRHTPAPTMGVSTEPLGGHVAERSV
jgi:hypothetical protein